MTTLKLKPARPVKSAPPLHEPAIPLRRGRPPKKAFINVLVRTSTRSALTHLKTVTGLPSQGEVIDYLVAELGNRRQLSV